MLGIISDAGAIIVESSGREIDPADEIGELDASLQLWIASRERKRIKERTAAGKARHAAQGHLVHGRPPFARTWNKLTHSWGVDDDLAAIYRRLFDLVLEGHPLRAIAKTLENERACGSRAKDKGELVPGGPGGGSWTAANISHLVHDPAAWGHYETHGLSFPIPHVVTRETFDAAARQLAKNNSDQGGRPTRHPALLRRLVACGECGSPLYTSKGGKKPWPARYYYCPTGDHAPAYHRLENLDASVSATVETWLSRPANLREASTIGAPEPQVFKDAIRKAQREIRQLDQQEERLARLLRKKLIQERTGERQLTEVIRDRADATARLAAAQASEEAAARRLQWDAAVESRIEALRAGLPNATMAERVEVMRLVFPRGGVVVWPDGRVELRGLLQVDSDSPPDPKPSGGRWEGGTRGCALRPPPARSPPAPLPRRAR